MKKNLLKMFGYYKPYMKIFWADMFFAALSSAVALIIPLIVRYVTRTLIYQDPDVIIHQMIRIAICLAVLLAIDSQPFRMQRRSWYRQRMALPKKAFMKNYWN